MSETKNPPETQSSPQTTADESMKTPPSSDKQQQSPSPSKNVDPETCILRRGDLVRVSQEGKRSSKRLKDRQDSLGRIAKVHHEDNCFDVEWILEGGRMTRARRVDLIRTTAVEEGMTDDTQQRRRKRQPPPEQSPPQQQQPDSSTNKKPPKKLRKDKKAPPKRQNAATKGAAAKKAAKRSSTTTTKAAKKTAKKSAKSTSTKNSKSTTTTTTGTAKKRKVTAEKQVGGKKRKAPNEKQVGGKKRKRADEPSSKAASSSSQSSTTTTPAAAAAAAAPPPAVDALYERHRRELERILTRLEKLDKFGFFLDPAPPEMTEVYTTTTTDDDDNETIVVYPLHPPYNWEMVRRRMERGRYVLDREEAEEDERFRLLEPYYATLDKQQRPQRRKAKCGSSSSSTVAVEDNPRVLHKKGVHWDLFRDDVVGMCNAAIERDEGDSSGERGSLTYAASKIKEEMMMVYERTGGRHKLEMSTADDRHKFAWAIEKQKNTEAAMQSWRKDPFPERRYEPLSSDVVCAGLSPLDERIASYELQTSLPDSFIGLSYRYDDTGQSEAWMKSVLDETGSNRRKKKSSARDNKERQAALAMAADDGVIRAQVSATMQSLLIGVQDRVMNETGVLRQPELRSANWIRSDKMGDSTTMENELGEGEERVSGDSSPTPSTDDDHMPEVVEQPVWGIDCYTRRNICLCLQKEFDSDTALVFVEKWLLPAINACPEELAHNIANAARLLEGHESTGDSELDKENCVSEKVWSHAPLRSALIEKIRTSAPPWLKAAANQLRRARLALGPDFFRVHPKGHGSVLLTSKVKANSLVTFYRGELYPSWRWGEKMDAIDITQHRKDLKPALPDFYNMALERPQTDPRGYGLLIVDASRKAGHGSSLSHSCAPTCEVRVAAVNGELCLAMTTLRELEMGEELTFDYNAVTESLNEYRSAVCLCGYGKCRGSFLHFATADCYQQILNRNAPIACRFANLVKGSMKQVMAEDDERVLRGHGFLTAAFGAISVNRRQETTVGSGETLSDSIDFVPVWLRTFVADTLRYIEYERRALPIALICDDLSTSKQKVKPESESSEHTGKETLRPETSFFYFLRAESDLLESLLKKEGFPDSIIGLPRRNALLKVASAYWQTLDEEKKQYWKDQARADFEKKKKADAKAKKPTGTGRSKPEISSVLQSSKMSFQDADAEGISAMEQRIQQLTQTLSRVGRVLDRHREFSFEEEAGKEAKKERDAASLRNRVHSPISVAPDEQIIGWMWNSSNGLVPSLFEAVRQARFARPLLLKKLVEARAKYSVLGAFGDPTSVSASQIDPADGRRLLSEALLLVRTILIDEVKEMGKFFRRYKSLMRDDQVKEVEEQDSDDSETEKKPPPQETSDACDTDPPSATIEDVVSSVMDDIVQKVELRVTGEIEAKSEAPEVAASKETTAEDYDSASSMLEANSWLEHYGERFVLLVSADLLLFYAHTKNFFVMKPYRALKSTPIEVYAREIGNTVPRSAIDPEFLKDATNNLTSTQQTDSSVGREGDTCSTADAANSSKPSPEHEFCQPDDIVAKVSVSYNGDYVLSQLLQWYNGGIGQKAGLPDMIGCVLLPLMAGCWSSDLLKKNKRRGISKSTYEGKIRPRLIEWLQDPYQRGDSWPQEIRKAFMNEDDDILRTDTSSLGLPFGSPIIDFLVTGDESSIFAVLNELDADDKVALKQDSNGLLHSVDNGRPAQAVSNWVQCEDPKCMKWRRIPWHVDIDLLPETFFCGDNKWDPTRNSCEAPEEDWDGHDKLVGADGKVEGSPARKDRNAVLSPLDQKNFFVGARFDVLREGKSKYTIGTVTKVDLSGKVKRIKFHFRKTKAEADEWIEFGSPRIAPLYSKVPKEQTKGKTKNGEGRLVCADGKVEAVTVKKAKPVKKTDTNVVLSPLEEKNFFVGARFDVLRQGKMKYTIGTVTDVDLLGEEKRIRFHFRKTKAEADEWIEFGSPRIAPLFSKVPEKATKKAPSKSSEESTFGHKNGVSANQTEDGVNVVLSPLEEKDFFVGARFDVLRQGKKKYTIGIVTEVDLLGEEKRIRFHFRKTKAEADEWIEFGSPRIAPLFSKVPEKATKKAPSKSPEESTFVHKNGVPANQTEDEAIETEPADAAADATTRGTANNSVEMQPDQTNAACSFQDQDQAAPSSCAKDVMPRWEQADNTIKPVGSVRPEMRQVSRQPCYGINTGQDFVPNGYGINNALPRPPDFMVQQGLSRAPVFHAQQAARTNSEERSGSAWDQLVTLASAAAVRKDSDGGEVVLNRPQAPSFDCNGGGVVLSRPQAPPPPPPPVHYAQANSFLGSSVNSGMNAYAAAPVQENRQLSQLNRLRTLALLYPDLFREGGNCTNQGPNYYGGYS